VRKHVTTDSLGRHIELLVTKLLGLLDVLLSVVVDVERLEAAED
jgi:hypothetical protein